MSNVRYFAADVSKRELVFAVYPEAAEVVRVANATAAITAWLDTLPAGSRSPWKPPAPIIAGSLRWRMSGV